MENLKSNEILEALGEIPVNIHDDSFNVSINDGKSLFIPYKNCDGYGSINERHYPDSQSFYATCHKLLNDETADAYGIIHVAMFDKDNDSYPNIRSYLNRVKKKEGRSLLFLVLMLYVETRNGERSSITHSYLMDGDSITEIEESEFINIDLEYIAEKLGQIISFPLNWVGSIPEAIH